LSDTKVERAIYPAAGPKQVEMRTKRWAIALCFVVASCGQVTRVETLSSDTAGDSVPIDVKRDARLLDVASVEIGSDRWLALYGAAEAECMKAAGFDFLPRTIRQLRGEEKSPNDEMLAGWPDDRVIAWSEALGGKVDPKSTDSASTGGGCTESAQERVWLFSAFPGLQAEVSGDRAVPFSDALYAVLAKHRDEIIAWYESWPAVKEVAA
jgi:hypothetical protein